jgi:CheY-like chemotaxis protein
VKIFILEDADERISAFIDNLKGHNLTICCDVPKAIEMFNPPYDLILLDHDLGETPLNGVQNDGTYFCEWLKQHGRGVGRVIVHSYNLDAGKRMISRLSAGGLEYGRWIYGLSLLHWLSGQPINPVVGEVS